MKDNIDMHFFQPKTEDGLTFPRNFPKKFASQKCRTAEGFQSVPGVATGSIIIYLLKTLSKFDE